MVTKAKANRFQHTIQDAKEYGLDSIRRTITVIYFGCKRDEKGKTEIKSEQYEQEFKAKYTTPEEAHEAVMEKIAKTVTFDFKDVSVEELLALNLTQTPVFKLWYNNELTKNTLAEIVEMPKAITVNVRDLLDGRNQRDSNLTKKSDAELDSETEKLMKRMAKIEAEKTKRSRGGETV